MQHPPEILVMGAGAIGCYVGGRLAASGRARVTLVARERIASAVAAQGLTLTDLDGGRLHAAAPAVTACTEVPAGARPDLVLLTVKSGATREAAQALAQRLPAGTWVLSLQNGVNNAAVAAEAAPALQVLPGMVPFNVAQVGPSAFHQGTEGQLWAQDGPPLRALAPVFAAAGLPLKLVADLRPVQWAKLLLNLNNPVNAASGLPLRAQLLDAGYRRCFAALMAEGLQVLRAAGIVPAQLTVLPASRLPWVLRLPTPLFRLLASRMLRIDALARSSMADDLAMGRATEIDELCGAIVRLAQQAGVAAPLNERMAALVREQSARFPLPAPALSRLLTASAG